MRFSGKFSDSLIPDELDKLSVSFLVDDLEVRRGGTAAKIAFGLARLGHRPVLVASVGRDFDTEYRGWLDAAALNDSKLLRNTSRETSDLLDQFRIG